MQFALVLYPKIESGMNTQHLKWHFSLISCFFSIFSSLAWGSWSFMCALFTLDSLLNVYSINVNVLMSIHIRYETYIECFITSIQHKERQFFLL